VPVLAAVTPAQAASGDSNAGTPVVYVHGFDPTGSGSNCGMWSAMRNFLTSRGFTGAQVGVKYYHNDANCSVNLNDYGSQGTHFPGGRINNQNSNNTDIRHIGYQFAWYVYNTYSSRGQNIGVVAHSMGGLVVRYALARVAARDADFPPSLSVSNIVTLGTPHAGANISLLCTLGNVECAQMAPGSSFLRSLGQNPQAAGGTDWSLLGSQYDGVVSYTSATSMTANHKVRYASSDGIDHGEYYTSTQTTMNASLTYSNNGAAYVSTTAGEWPVLRSQKALSGAGF
jgi:hypothetical protein